ncbi:MAG: hypothetical protein V4525_10945 [Pseudomonadota bacterium]
MIDLESQLRIFFASSPQTKHPIQTIQISHTAIETYYLWPEQEVGSVVLEDATTVQMRPINLMIKLADSEGHLDKQYTISFDITDATDEFREALDDIPLNTKEKVLVTYREYLSDDLTTVQARAKLEVESISYTRTTATISAVSKRLNLTRTGEVYTPRTIPMLRGFL